MPEVRPGVVSVVLVNYKGADDTLACLRAFDEVDWPADRLELIVVDNASGDGSVETLRAAGTRATVVESSVNTGFTGGCNLGVEHATGEYVGFINNDARPGREWVSAAVAVLEHDSRIGAVASKVLDWDGRLVDYVDGSLTWYGMGYKREVERPDSPDYDVAKDVLFATGAAMFVRTALYREVGGFDEKFFMFYEDVDLGWRLNLLGHRVRYVPGSVAYHRHHVTMKKFGQWREHFLLERNALMAMYKNYSDGSLARTLAPAMAIALRRGIARGGDDPGVLDLQRGAGQEDVDRIEVGKATLAPAYAIDSFLDHLPELTQDRERLQAARRRDDKDLVPLFRQLLEPAYPDERYLEAHRRVVEAFGIEEHFSTRRRVVIATAEPLAQRMAGPAIRAYQIAAALSAEHDVELVTLGRCELEDPRFRTSHVTSRDLRRLEAWCDIFLFQGLIMAVNPWLAESRKVIVCDVYDPFHLEQLEQAKDKGDVVRREIVRDCTQALNDQLARGDFFLCASDKQRDFWLGQLSAMGRINVDTYDEDESLDSLIAVVPFGVGDVPPQHHRNAIKGVVDGIGPDDKVILWGGGIYNWFDPITLIKAIDQLRRKRDDVRLYFLGVKHPNPDVPAMRMAADAQELADKLGLTGRHVFFNEGWVAYDDRQNYLLEADIGVSTHLPHVETAFSFRTRILDYLWASLPIVATEGDTFAEIIPARGLGLTVPPEDVDALEEALLRLLDDTGLAATCRANIEAMVPGATWSAVLQPLVDFCRSPRRAADLVEGLGDAAVRPPSALAVRRRSSLREDVVLFRTYLQQGGAQEVARRAVGRVKRRVRETVG